MRFLLPITLTIATEDQEGQNLPNISDSAAVQNRVLDGDNLRICLYEHWLQAEGRNMQEDANVPGINYYGQPIAALNPPILLSTPSQMRRQNTIGMATLWNMNNTVTASFATEMEICDGSDERRWPP